MQLIQSRKPTQISFFFITFQMNHHEKSKNVEINKLNNAGSEINAHKDKTKDAPRCACTTTQTPETIKKSVHNFCFFFINTKPFSM